jgi:hypothetical protein
VGAAWYSVILSNIIGMPSEGLFNSDMEIARALPRNISDVSDALEILLAESFCCGGWF